MSSVAKGISGAFTKGFTGSPFAAVDSLGGIVGLEPFKRPKTPTTPDQGKTGEELSQEQQAAETAIATEADRESRIKRARQLLRGGTISTSPLGSPLGGVALTRPRLGGT